jgi:hypothetical protein
VHGRCHIADGVLAGTRPDVVSSSRVRGVLVELDLADAAPGPGDDLNRRTPLAVSFFEPALVVAGAAYAVGPPIRDPIRTTWDPITPAAA